MFPLVLVSPLFSIKKSVSLFKDGNFRVPKLRCGVPLCPPDSHGTMAALEIVFVTNFHSDNSGEAVV